MGSRGQSPKRRNSRSGPGVRKDLSILGLTAFLIFLQVPGSLAKGPLRTGADRICSEPYRSWIEGKRIGLITNQTGVTSELRPLSELITSRPGNKLSALFAPEHGMGGFAQAGETVLSGSKIFSLYGKHRRPTPTMLAEVDVLVFDIQDVGARFYTYTATMFESMKAAAETGKIFIVLDRPNPIDGTRTEGPVMEKTLESFLGIAGIPIRHGMTAGEIARLLRSEKQLELDLRIVPLSGWKRTQWFDETGLQWIAPSPNMPTLKTATVYPGLCLIEGTNLSEGRGTTLPFELVGSPWLDSDGLASELNHLGLGGVHFRPQDFKPTFSKYQGTICRGLQIHVLDRTKFRPVETALHLLRQIKLRHPEQLQFADSTFDHLAGNRRIREQLERGASVESLVAGWQSDLQEFRKRREKYLLY